MEAHWGREAFWESVLAGVSYESAGPRPGRRLSFDQRAKVGGRRAWPGRFLMLVHPQFDPIAIQLGPLAVRWYGLMYLVGFALCWLAGRYRIKQRPGGVWVPKDLDDALFWII